MRNDRRDYPLRLRSICAVARRSMRKTEQSRDREGADDPESRENVVLAPRRSQCGSATSVSPVVSSRYGLIPSAQQIAYQIAASGL